MTMDKKTEGEGGFAVIDIDWNNTKSMLRNPDDEPFEEFGKELYDNGTKPEEIFDKVSKKFEDMIMLPENTTRVSMAYAKRALEKDDVEGAIKTYQEAGRLGWGMGLEDPAVIDLLGNAYKNPELVERIEKCLYRVIEKEEKELRVHPKTDPRTHGLLLVS